MNEQEKREKAIEEMLNELEMWFDHEPSWLSSKAKAQEIVGRLGYRKEEEVRKETIKAFISFVESVIYNYKPTVTETDSGIKTHHYLTDYQILDIIKEKYGK